MTQFHHIRCSGGANPFAGTKVAVLGDAMLDQFIYGSVSRISPEAPIPVVRVTKRTTHLGGAGNAAANLVAFGAVPLLVARLGDDRQAEDFRKEATALGISMRHVMTTPVPTTCKSRIIARSQQVVRFDDEQLDPLEAADREAMAAHLVEVRKQTDVILISDYGKGMVDNETLSLVKELWGDGEIIVDPKPRKRIDYTGVTGMTPNIQETADILAEDWGPSTDDEAADMAQALVTRLGLKHVLLTRAGDGMTICEASGAVVHLPAHAQEVTDVSGAGDTVISVLCAGLAAGMGLEEAARVANVAGSVVVAKLGTASASWEEIRDGMAEQYPEALSAATGDDSAQVA